MNIKKMTDKRFDWMRDFLLLLDLIGSIITEKQFDWLMDDERIISIGFLLIFACRLPVDFPRKIKYSIPNRKTIKYNLDNIQISK